MKKTIIISVLAILVLGLMVSGFTPKSINIKTRNSGTSKYNAGTNVGTASGNFNIEKFNIKTANPQQIGQLVSAVKSRNNFDYSSFQSMLSAYRNNFVQGTITGFSGSAGTTNKGTVNRGTTNRGTVNRGTTNRGTVNRGTTNRGTVNRGTSRGTVSRGTVNGKETTFGGTKKLDARMVKFDEYIKSDLIKDYKSGKFELINTLKNGTNLSNWSLIKTVPINKLYMKRNFDAEEVKKINEKLEKKKQEFKERRKLLSETKEKIREALKSGDKEKALELMKEAASQLSDKVVDFLNTKKEKILSDPRLSEDEASRLASLIDNAISKIPSYAQKINNAESMSDVKDVLKELKMEWGNIKKDNMKIDSFQEGRKLNEFNVRATQMEATLKSFIEENDISLSDEDQKKLDEALDHIANAKAIYDQIESLKDAILNGDESAINKAKELYKEGKEEAEEAKSILEELYDKLKDEIGEIDLSDNEEVPVIVPPPKEIDLPPMPPPVTTMPTDGTPEVN